MRSSEQRIEPSKGVWPGILLALALPVWSSAAAEVTDPLQQTQRIELVAGWNAVFFEVEPPDEVGPDELFAGTPIDVVASWFPRASSVEYISDPGTRQWKKEGWGVWYAPGRDDAFLKNLRVIHGNRAYLIHTPQAHLLELTGAATTARINWRAGSYNLVGFGLDSNAPPTFEEFFSPSKAHQPLKAYRLEDGRWKLVSDPATTQMRSGEAYWVYCKLGSDYQGPVSLHTALYGRVLLNNAAATGEIAMRNHTSAPVDVQISDASAGEGSLGLNMVIRAIEETGNKIALISTELPALFDFPPLAAGSSMSVRVAPQTTNMSAASQSALLEVRTSLGTRFWLPVIGFREDLGEGE